MKKILNFLLFIVLFIRIDYSYTIPIDSSDIILMSRVGASIGGCIFGGMVAGDLDGNGKKELIIQRPFGGVFEWYEVRILWDDFADSDTVIVNNYPVLINYDSNSEFGECYSIKIFDINNDGYDDLFYSFPREDIILDYISSIGIIYGKPRRLWSNITYVNSMHGADATIIGIYGGRKEGLSIIFGDYDDSTGYELITGSDAGSSSELLKRGHITIIDVNSLPDSGIVYSDSIKISTILGQLPRIHGISYSDTESYMGSYLSNLGDLNSDGIDDFSSNAFSWYYIFHGPPLTPIYDTIPGFYTPKNFIFWGRPREMWRIYDNSTVNAELDSLVTLIYTYWQGQITSGDIDGDGYKDLIITDCAIFLYYEYYCSLTWFLENDTTKIYIIFGGQDTDSLKGGIFIAEDIADLIIKSRFPCDGTGVETAIGDFNGDGIDDFAVQSANKQDPGVIYVFFGNRERNFPRYIQNAPLKIVVDDTIKFGDTILDSLFIGASVRMIDLNNDGIDELIFSNLRELNYYYNVFDEVNKLIDIGYIFINKYLSVELLDYHDSNLGSSETLKFKINYKYPLKLSSIKVSINGDTFTIHSPRLEYISTDSILILLPDSAWDSTRGYWICIQNITDTIGTPPDSLPLCFGFNGATTAVYEPPKPQTLSLTCYPNPFNAEVRIRLCMPDAGDVKIDIYDISGKLIDCIHKSKLTAGWHELVWRPRISVPSGVYLLRISAGGEAVVRRVVLVR